MSFWIVWTLGTIAVLLLIAAGIWNAFRRRAPYLSDDDLVSLNTDENEYHIVRKLTSEDRNELAKAFAFGSDVVWMHNGDQQENQSITDESEKQELLIQASYMMDFVAILTESYGHIIKCIDKQTGKYLGCLCLIPPESLKWMSFYELATFLKVGMPPLIVRNDKDRYARFWSQMQIVEQHDLVMKSYPKHWHLITVGVSVDAQGRGIGSQLVKQAQHISSNDPLYLECHDQNVQYYEKKGFALKKRFKIVPKGANETDGFAYNCMVYNG